MPPSQGKSYLWMTVSPFPSESRKKAIQEAVMERKSHPMGTGCSGLDGLPCRWCLAQCPKRSGEGNPKGSGLLEDTA
jgi:hypothetical protein